MLIDCQLLEFSEIHLVFSERDSVGEGLECKRGEETKENEEFLRPNSSTVVLN